jgi:hypothetical protein
VGPGNDLPDRLLISNVAGYGMKVRVRRQLPRVSCQGSDFVAFPQCLLDQVTTRIAGATEHG